VAPAQDIVGALLPNLGMLPHDRAINFVATNALSVEKVYE
jgi:hypothetical protein